MNRMKHALCLAALLCGASLNAGCSDDTVVLTPPEVPQWPAEEESGTVQNGDFRVFQADALLKMLESQTSSISPDLFGQDTLRCARGENAVLQLVVQAPNGALSDVQVQISALKTAEGATLEADKVRLGWVESVTGTRPPWDVPFENDLLKALDNRYPDPVIDAGDEPLVIEGNCQRFLIADITVPRDAKAGLYEGTLSLKATTKIGEKSGVEFPVSVQVYPVTMPAEQGLKVVNWHSFSFAPMNNGVFPEYFSEDYFTCLKAIGNLMGSYGQNMWCFRDEVAQIVDFTPDKSSFIFADGKMEECVEFLMKEGNLKYFSSGFHGARDSETGLFTYQVSVFDEEGNLYSARVRHDDPRLEQFVKLYFPALQEHLRSKKLNDGTGRTWLDIYAHHLADEPNADGPNLDSYRAFAKLVKKYAPDLKIIDACSSVIPEQDIRVPVLNERITEYDKVPTPAGKERWIYTAMWPQQLFANRFLQQPTLKTRLLHWLNYKYHATGYLHWGMNYWWEHADPRHNVSHNFFPDGDSYILYPGYHKAYPSLRLIAMRDGIRDYDLLKLVEAKDEARARAFVDEIIQGPMEYDMSIPHFRNVRKAMLEFLSTGK